MAIIKRKAIKSTLKKALSYVLEKKVAEKDFNIRNELNYISNKNKIAFTSSLNCSANVNLAATQMENLKERFGKTDKRLAYHYIQSFEVGEVDAKTAFEIGKKFAEKNFKNCQVVFSTHQDKAHIHNHFIVNSVMLNGKKFVSDLKSLYQAREINDEICKAHDLSVIENKTINFKRELVKNDIDKNILLAKNYDEFINLMIKSGYKIKDQKYISFTPPTYTKAVRNKMLGEEYTKENIIARIERNNVKSKKILIENDIKDAMSEAASFEDFKRRMEEKNKRLYKNIDKTILNSGSYDAFVKLAIREGLQVKPLKDGNTDIRVKKIVQLGEGVINLSQKNNINFKKEIIKDDIERTIQISSSFEDFKKKMEIQNYKVRQEKQNLYFKHQNFKYEIKASNLGGENGLEDIKKRIAAQGLYIKEPKADRTKKLVVDIMRETSYLSTGQKIQLLDENIEKLEFLTKNDILYDPKKLLEAEKNIETGIKRLYMQENYNRLAVKELDEIEKFALYYNKHKDNTSDEKTKFNVEYIRNHFTEKGININKLDTVLNNVLTKRETIRRSDLDIAEGYKALKREEALISKIKLRLEEISKKREIKI